MNSVEDLDVFKLAHELALKTCAATKSVPERRVIQFGGSDAPSCFICGDEPDGGSDEARHEGVSSVCRHRPWIGGRGLLAPRS